MPVLLNSFRFGGGGSPPATDDFFASDGATQPWLGPVTSPSAFYDATSGVTWFAWEGYGAGSRRAMVTTHNHGTGSWTDRVLVEVSQMTDDGHGPPAICMDADGYVHLFHGVHNGNMLYAGTVNANDPSEWTARGSISGNYTYPHPSLVGSTIYLFLRHQFDSSTFYLVLRTATPSGGRATFGAHSVIVNFGTNTRVYNAVNVVSGTDIHLCCTRSDGADTTRLNAYHFVYDTTTGSVRNSDGSVTVASGSLPIDLTTADTSFRVRASSPNVTDIPAFCLDSTGAPHLVYPEGSGSSFNLYHVHFTAGAWTSPTLIGSIPGSDHAEFNDSIALVPLASGNLELWYPKDPGSFTAGGDMVRRLYTSGSWGSESTILAAGSNGLARAKLIRNAHANARVMFCEVAQTENLADAPGHKCYAYGDSGFLTRPQDAAPTDAHIADVGLLLDGSRDGTGTDASFANVILILDGVR